MLTSPGRGMVVVTRGVCARCLVVCTRRVAMRAGRCGCGNAQSWHLGRRCWLLRWLLKHIAILSYLQTSMDFGGLVRPLHASNCLHQHALDVVEGLVAASAERLLPPACKLALSAECLCCNALVGSEQTG